MTTPDRLSNPSTSAVKKFGPVTSLFMHVMVSCVCMSIIFVRVRVSRTGGGVLEITKLPNISVAALHHVLEVPFLVVHQCPHNHVPRPCGQESVVDLPAVFARRKK